MQVKEGAVALPGGLGMGTVHSSKRLRKRDHRWWADSDNEKYEPQTLDDRARIMGRVVWWAHTD